MVDFNCCDHECACQHNGHLEAAQQYSSILSKVMSKNADSEYVSKEDKDNWNNKANKDLVDLIKVMVEKHEERLDDLEDNLDKKIKHILYDLGLEDNILSKYATIEYVNELVAKIKNEQPDLSKYALKADIETIKNEIYNKIDKLITEINGLETEINNIKINGGKDYSIESMTYQNGQLALKQKNGGTFAVSIYSGIDPDTSKYVTKDQLRTELNNYVEKHKLKGLRINGVSYSLYGDGEIEVPTGSGDGSDGKDGGHYKPYFKNTKSETEIPQRPANGSAPSEASGWTENAVNRKTGEYTWMTQVFVSGDGSYGEYIFPICLTGSKGDQGPQGPSGGSSGTGADTSDRDFCYHRTLKGHDIKEVQMPSGDNYRDWTDNPQGVGYYKEGNKTFFYDNEWMCVRVKANGVWGDWVGPVLWSHYGENGTDGDGVEYIFTKTSTSVPLENPSTWYTNEQSKANGKDDAGSCSWEDGSGTAYYNTKYFNEDEYIKKGSRWYDDPSSIEDQHPGDKIWVSVRKKRNDSNPNSAETEDAYWHQYSQPKIWSYYAKDGLVEAVIIDVVGETRYVYIDPATKLSKKYNADITVNMFNSGDPISKALQFYSFKRSDGTDMSSLRSSFTFNADSIKVDFADNALNFNNDAYYILTITGTPSGSVSNQTRYAEILFYGISNEGTQGEPGKTIGIYTTASAISLQDGSLYPDTIGAFVRYGEGSTFTEYKPSNPGGWKFSYKVDDNDWEDMTSDTIQSQGGNGISFKAVKVNTILGDTTLQEYVPIVKSGIDGINGVTYRINVKNMQLQYHESSNNKELYSLNAQFNVELYKKEGNEDYVRQNTSGYTCNVSKNPPSDGASINATPAQDQTGWTCSVVEDTAYSAATIQVFINNSNDAFVDSITIPISAAGKDGNAGTGQTLKGSPLRIKGAYVKPSGTSDIYLDGKRASDDDGVFYQDVVLYNNAYYACINTDKGIKQNWDQAPDVATYWQNFSVNESFVSDKIIANQGYIKELSSKEVVIFDGDENIVAGMTSSKAINDSDLNKYVTAKGNVRIWAGQFTEGDLTTAPFTVTDAGVLKCKGTSGNSIELKDGTIYFIVDGITYHLGITNNKPDWIGGIDSMEVYNFTNIDDKKVNKSTAILYSSNGKYYTNSRLTTLANGTYYIHKGVSNIVRLNATSCLIGTYGAIAQVYQQATFTDGNIREGKLLAIGPKVTYSIGSTTPNITDGNYWYDIEDSQTISNYYIMNEDNVYGINSSNVSYNGNDTHLYLIYPSTVGNANGTNYSIGQVAFNQGDPRQSTVVIATRYV